MLAGSLRRRCLAPKKTFFGDWRPGLLFDSGHATAWRTKGRGKAPANKRAYSNKPESREQSNNQQRNGQRPTAPLGRGSGQPEATGQGLRAGVAPPCLPPAPSGASNEGLWPRAIFLEVLNGLSWSRELAAEEMESRYLPLGWAGLGCPALPCPARTGQGTGEPPS